MSACSLVSFFFFLFFQQQTMHLPFDMASFSFLLSTVNSARLLEKQKNKKTKTIFIITCYKKNYTMAYFFRKIRCTKRKEWINFASLYFSFSLWSVCFCFCFWFCKNLLFSIVTVVSACHHWSILPKVRLMILWSYFTQYHVRYSPFIIFYICRNFPYQER